MKIERPEKSENYVLYEDIDLGECFKDEYGVIYYKCENESGDAIDICLGTGEYEGTHACDDRVIPVKGKFVVEEE